MNLTPEERERLMKLDTNWNSYGAPAPSKHTIDAAIRLLECNEYRPSHVGPSAAGGTGVTYLWGDLEIAIEYRSYGDILLSLIEKDCSCWVVAIPALANLAALEQRVAELENLNRVLCEQKPDGLQYQDVLKQLNERQERLNAVTRERDDLLVRERELAMRLTERDIDVANMRKERDELQRRVTALGQEDE